MLHRAPASLAILLALTIPAAAHAQATVAGRWTTTVDIGFRVENGEETSMGKRAVTMTLAVTGDSVSGKWQVEAEADGTTPPPIALHGTAVNGKVQLQSDPIERTLRMNDDAMKVHLITAYAFQVRGDSAVGTSRTHDAEGMMEGKDRAFTAVRVKQPGS